MIFKLLRNSFGLFLILLFGISTTFILQFPEEQKFELFLDKSGPYVGVNYPHELGYDGTGIIIGVIDTGIDYRHPDLLGLGPEGKIIKDYNFFNDDESSLAGGVDVAVLSGGCRSGGIGGRSLGSGHCGGPGARSSPPDPAIVELRRDGAVGREVGGAARRCARGRGVFGRSRRGGDADCFCGHLWAGRARDRRSGRVRCVAGSGERERSPS